MGRAGVAYVGAISMSLIVLGLFGPLDRRIAMTGHDDFANIWAGPRVFVTGGDPYDAATWMQAARDVGTSPPDRPAVYIYPPWAALALTPLALLPLGMATLAWVLGGAAAAVLVVGLLCRELLPGRPTAHAAVATTLLLSGPAVSTLLTGQWTFVLVAALGALVLALRADRPVAAAILALAMAMKPQVFLLAAPALAVRALWPSARRERGTRFVVAAAGSGIALLALSTLLLPSWWPAWPYYTSAAQLNEEHVTIPALLFRSIGPPGAIAGFAVLAAAVAVAARFHPRGPAWLPVWLTLSVTAAPYANAYDLLVLVVPLVLAARAADRVSARRQAVVLAGGIAILLVGATLLHDLALLAYAPLVPAGMLVLTITALWDLRRESGDAGI